jgi:hypothetical protein
VAVRADDIALLSLGKEPMASRAANEPRDSGDFCRRVAMIKVHRAGRKPAAAVGAWDGAQGVEQPSMHPPSIAPFDEVLRGPATNPLGKSLLVADPGPNPVAVRANNVALGDFSQ